MLLIRASNNAHIAIIGFCGYYTTKFRGLLTLDEVNSRILLEIVYNYYLKIPLINHMFKF